MREIRFHRPSDEWGCFATRSPHPVHLDGCDWPTVEHFLIGQRFADDDAIRTQVRDTTTSADAAALALRERSRIRPDWADVRDAVMYRALLAKFTQHETLGERLLATENAVLVEHAHGDGYWGDGGDGTGRNMLGWTLMAVREELRRSRVTACAGD